MTELNLVVLAVIPIVTTAAVVDYNEYWAVFYHYGFVLSNLSFEQ